MVNMAVVVVRYFGGTLLGVPGLINAYKSATALALQTTPAVQRAVERRYRLEFDYTLLNPVMTLVKKYNCRVREQELQLFCRMDIGIPKNRLEEVRHHLGEMHGITVTEAAES
jgi:putative IMPACT (imprinted ancient) family translation regulator